MQPNPRLDEAMGIGRRGFRPQASTSSRSNAPIGELLLPGEQSAATLTERTTHANAPKAVKDRGKVIRTYKWMQFHGREEITEFDEAHFTCEGKFQQNSSQGHKEYQDRLRCIHLRKEGKSKTDIAKALGRSEKFVAKWWQKDQNEMPRPWGVHAYLTKEMGQKASGVGATNGATMTDDSVHDTATWWRDVEIRRKYATDPSIYNDILQNTEWKSNNARTRDFSTGAYHLKYDQQGNIKWQGNQGGKYKQGVSPAMDKVMQQLFAEYGIADRTSGVIVNWYPDGKGYLGSHRHDCWTALFSFGHERILTMDNTPLLMQHGDLCIFGTQRHGVPIMPEITEGRITLVVFFYPDSMQKQGMWQTITDPETMAPSRPLVAMLRDKHLSSAEEKRTIEESSEIRALQELGFSKADSEIALRASHFDLEQSASLLLLSGKGLEKLDDSGLDLRIESCMAPERTGRFRKKQQAVVEDTCSTISSCNSTAAGSSVSHDSTASSSSSSAACSSNEETDEALARRLQLDEEGASGGFGKMQDEELMALALHYEELDREQQIDPGLLAAQFEEYDETLTRKDAERWNGHGDLMHSAFAREHLSIDSMDKATLYSVGHGDMLERDFWEMLQCHSIRVLYDIRQTDYRGELYSRHERFSVNSLRSQCRSRGIVYKPMPVGRESAYGTLAHIKTDEGRHTLVELVWQANRKRTAFLGKEELWNHDARQVVAEELTKVGHDVEHVCSDGSIERHKLGVEYPDWLVREEERLKVLEKKRQAGELETPQKSRTDRSSEAIASKLARPADEVDAMKELSNAANQKELIVAQRKLARYQRIAEDKGALATKVVKSVPQWVQDDAHKQAEWVSAKKKEKAEKTEHAREEPVVTSDHVGIECASGADEGDEEEDAMLRQALAESALLAETLALAEAPSQTAKASCQNDGKVGLEPQRSAWRSRRKNVSSPEVDTQPPE